MLVFERRSFTAFKVDVDPSRTVADLKAEINNSKGYDIGTQKLIFSGRFSPFLLLPTCVTYIIFFRVGKNLADGEILGTIGFKEKDFLLLLMSKSKVSLEPRSELQERR